MIDLIRLCEIDSVSMEYNSVMADILGLGALDAGTRVGPDPDAFDMNI